MDGALRPAGAYDGMHFMSYTVAGSLAGVGEHVAMYPIDTIKTRMQALSHPGQQLHASTLRALRAALRREGARGLYAGVGAAAAGAGPAHAVYFGVYEVAKEALGGNRSGHQPLAVAAAGAAATVVSDAAMNPADVIKQRLQVAHSPYSGALDCLRQVLRQEGVGALFRSYRTTIIMNIPYTAVHFPIYESSKKLLNHLRATSASSSSPNSPSAAAAAAAAAAGTAAAAAAAPAAAQGSEAGPLPGLSSVVAASPEAEAAEAEEEGLAVQVLAGGLAGGAAAAVTNPLDVVKTRLQTEGMHSSRRYATSAVVPMLRRIVQEEGAAAIWRGWQPRVLFNAPSAAICWGIYESSKALLLQD